MLFFFQGKTAPNALWPEYPNFGENLFGLILFPNKDNYDSIHQNKVFFGWKREKDLGTFMNEV